MSCAARSTFYMRDTDIDFDAPLEFGGTRRQNKVPMSTEDVQYREFQLTQAKHRLSALKKF